jgi:hypothetical protein
MLALTIDSPMQSDGCVTCCCETISLKPGETQPLYLNYAGWAAPIALRGLHCEPTITVEEKKTCDVITTGNLPPVASSNTEFDVTLNTPLTADLKTFVTDPEADTLTFKPLLLYGTQHGKFSLKSDGTFTYTPVQGYVGPDNCFVSVSDGHNQPVVFEVLFGVGVPASDVGSTWDLVVGKPIVNQRLYLVTLPLTVSPAARTCQIFRLTVRQGALDCDCNCYYHVDCVDVRIVQC